MLMAQDPLKPPAEDRDQPMSGEAVGLVIVCVLFFVFIIAVMVVWHRRSVDCVHPARKTDEAGREKITAMIEEHKKIPKQPMSVYDPFANRPKFLPPRKGKKHKHTIDISADMIAEGAVNQMKIHRNSMNHEVTTPLVHPMVERPPSPHAKGDTSDKSWFTAVKKN